MPEHQGKGFRPSVFVKGMAMGAADVVPGVSGGTVAFITGIYEELVGSLSKADLTAVKLLLKGQVSAFWTYINGTFLATVFAGILLSIFSLAKIISWVLVNHPKIIWSYFFGLILVSVFMLAKQANLFSLRNALVLFLGAWFAFEITRLTQVAIAPSTTFIFLSGAIAICAMILPGISGSFILVLLGMYQYIIEGVKSLDVSVLGVFILGCIVGLLSFTHLLSWLLSRYRELTFALLTGFMAGSLNKVWPWKITNTSQIEQNVSPFEYQSITQAEPQIVLAIAALVMGILTVYLIDRVGNDQSTR